MSFFYESAPDHKDYHLMKHKSAHPALLHFHAAYELLIVESGERTVRMGNNGKATRRFYELYQLGKRLEIVARRKIASLDFEML